MQTRLMRAGKGEPFVLRYLQRHGTSTPSQLASALRATRPGLRVLFASGSAADVPGPLLSKPYTPAELLAAVSRALDV